VGNIGSGEILVVLLIALLVLGPTRLPDAARQIGKAMAEFRRVTSGLQTEMRDAMADLDREVSFSESPPTFPEPAAEITVAEGLPPAGVRPPAVADAWEVPDMTPPVVDPAPAPAPDPDPDPVTEAARTEPES
jgi:sec-independent protein translocase protein TatB